MSIGTEWQVEMLYIEAYSDKIANVSASEIWGAQLDFEPDEVHQFKRERMEGQEGDHKNGRIVLIKRQDQVEWRYQANQDDESAGFPIVGSLEDELSVIVELGKRWLRSPELFIVNDLVFGAMLLNPADSLHSGFDTLKRYLPSLRTEGLSDVLYRVNRPRNSQVVDNLLVNRETWWTVARSYQDYATRLRFDINTKADKTEPLSPTCLVKLLEEMVNWGLELSMEGDIA
jgi:hypothetical protein